MNTIPIIHLDQWVRREAKTSLANFHNSQNPESRSATMDTIISPRDERESCGGSGEVAGRCFEWCWLLYTSCVPLLFAHCVRAQRPEGRETTPPVPVCSISARYLSHTADRWRVLQQQPAMPAGEWPLDLCLISSPVSDRDPYCQLSLA